MIVKPIIIYTTTGLKSDAKSIANHLIKNKLAACVNIISNIESVYEWQSDIQYESEHLLMIKTTENQVDQINKFFTSNHPYDLAELITVDITGGSAAYLQWIKDSLTPRINE